MHGEIKMATEGIRLNNFYEIFFGIFIKAIEPLILIVLILYFSLDYEIFLICKNKSQTENLTVQMIPEILHEPFEDSQYTQQ